MFAVAAGQRPHCPARLRSLRGLRLPVASARHCRSSFPSVEGQRQPRRLQGGDIGSGAPLRAHDRPWSGMAPGRSRSDGSSLVCSLLPSGLQRAYRRPRGRLCVRRLRRILVLQVKSEEIAKQANLIRAMPLVAANGGFARKSGLPPDRGPPELCVILPGSVDRRTQAAPPL